MPHNESTFGLESKHVTLLHEQIKGWQVATSLNCHQEDASPIAFVFFFASSHNREVVFQAGRYKGVLLFGILSTDLVALCSYLRMQLDYASTCSVTGYVQ